MFRMKNSRGKQHFQCRFTIQFVRGSERGEVPAHWGSGAVVAVSCVLQQALYDAFRYGTDEELSASCDVVDYLSEVVSLFLSIVHEIIAGTEMFSLTQRLNGCLEQWDIRVKQFLQYLILTNGWFLYLILVAYSMNEMNKILEFYSRISFIHWSDCLAVFTYRVLYWLIPLFDFE